MKKTAIASIIGLSLALAACKQAEQSEQKTVDAPLVEKVDKKTQQPAAGVQMLLPNFTQLVEEVGPAVVNIQVRRKNTDNPFSHFGGNGENDPFFDFFKRFIPEEIQPESESMGFGSGFIINADGYILTNAHVVKDSTSIKVSLKDKREFIGELIGVDSASDVAVIKIKADQLPFVKIGSPQNLQVGEWVAAIGAPFGFDNTVTAGIVSAKKRNLPGENYVPFIQTDVAINPGNSGGPLFNLQGEVIGINSQIYSRSGGFMGISFAVPIDVAINVAEQLKKGGSVKRGKLGVVIQEVSYDLAKSFGLEKPHGALVVRVMPNGPAEQAKIAVGDVILAVNGETVQSSSDLPLMIGSMSPESKVKIDLWRNKKTLSVDVVLSKMDTDSDDEKATDKPQENGGQFELADIGVKLSPLSPDAAKSAGVKGGLLVLNANRKARSMGLMRSDIIIAVGQTDVVDERGLREALTQAKSNGVAPLYIMRDKQALFLPLPLN